MSGTTTDQGAVTTSPPPSGDPQLGTKARLNVGAALGAGYSAKEITDFLTANPGWAQFRTKDALAAGYSPEEIIDHLNPSRTQENYQGVPVLAPIQRGATQAEQGVANLADDFGWHRAASAIRSHLNQGVVSTPTSGAGVVNDIKAGNYGAALEAAPSAVLEQALPAGAAMLAGVASGGSIPVAMATGAGIGALTQGDDLARARAANNGHATPTATDLALGLAGGAGLGALGTVGLPGGVGAAASGLKGALLNTAAHGAADALQPQAAALAGSVGTDNGPQLAPASDSAAAALTGIVGRSALAAPGIAAGAIPSVRASRQAAAYASMTPDQQNQVQNIVAAHGALQDAYRSSVRDFSMTPKVAAATASDGITTNVARLVGTLGSQGVLSSDDAQTIGATMKAARSPNMALTNAHLDALDGLGLDPSDATALKNAAVRLDILSDPQSLQAGAGPFQGLGNVLGGHIGGALVGSLLGGPAGAGAGYLVGAAVRPVVKGAVRSLGSALDNAAGFNVSPLEKAAGNGRALLDAAGVTVPDAAGDLAAQVMKTRNAIDAQRALLAPSQPPVVQAAVNRVAAQGSLGASSGGVQRPASGDFQGPSGLPPVAQGTPDPIAVAQARAAASGAPAANVAGPGVRTFAPDVSGLSPAALALAQRLPEWTYGLGANLESALHQSGMARPVNYAGEVNAALDSLKAKGLLPDDIATGLKGHQGRVVPVLYDMLRNELLLQNGLDRTAGGEGLPAQTSST